MMAAQQDDLTIPKFLLRGKDNALLHPAKGKAKGRAKAAAALPPRKEEMDPSVAVLEGLDAPLRAALEREISSHRFRREWLLSPESVAMFRELFEERQRRREEGLARLASLPREERAPKPVFGLGVKLLLLADGNPRKAGTAAYDRFAEMAHYLRKNSGATVADVLANTAYRKDDLSWDLGRNSVKTDIQGKGSDGIAAPSKIDKKEGKRK